MPDDLPDDLDTNPAAAHNQPNVLDLDLDDLRVYAGQVAGRIIDGSGVPEDPERLARVVRRWLEIDDGV